MKRTSCFIVFVLFLLLVQSVSAKIWIVNNNPNVTGQSFKTAQTAHDGAAVGDTLYFIGSPDSYGNLILRKSLVVIGPGYWLNENNISVLNKYRAYIEAITYSNSASASTKMFSIACSYIQVNVSNVQINNMLVEGSVTMTKSNNVSIYNSYVGTISMNDTCKNISIKNNIIYGSINAGTRGGNVIISNNALYGSGNYYVYNSTFENNIFIDCGITTDPNYLQTMNFSYNMANNSILPAGSGNINNIKVDEILVWTNSTPDGKFKLANGSPAIGAGHNGVDMGAFGGDTPYKLSGVPAIPSIYYFTSGGTGTNAQGIQVQVKIKSNN